MYARSQSLLQRDVAAYSGRSQLAETRLFDSRDNGISRGVRHMLVR